MIVLGIDIGVTGACAVHYGGEIKHVFDLPTVENGSGTVKRKLDGRTLAMTIFNALDRNHSAVTTAYIEHQRGMPDQGSATVFSLGHSLGVVQGVLAAMNIPFIMVEPVVWKAHYGLRNPNQNSRQKKIAALNMARKLAPSSELHLHKHHNRAEAILIALYGNHTRLHGEKK